MALRTDSINPPVENKLEEGYEFVVDDQGRRALRKIRNVKKEPAKVSKKASKKVAKKAKKEE